MSQPHDHRNLSGSREREPGRTPDSYGQGNALGDQFGSSQSATPPAAGNNGVRDCSPSSNTGCSTHNPAASRAGNPPQSDSVRLPLVSFEDAGGMGGLNVGAQSSIRSTINQPPEVTYTDYSSGLGEGSTTLVHGVHGAPTGDPSTVSELTIPPTQVVALDQVSPGQGMPGSDLDIQSNVERSRPTTVADTTPDELVIPPPKGVISRFINKVEHCFHTLPREARRSSEGLPNIGRQAGPSSIFATLLRCCIPPEETRND